LPLDLEPIRSEPAYRLVAQMLEGKILSGEIAIGEALPSELTLSAMLGVNRSTLREAIRSLEEGGLVRRSNGGKRLFVTVPRQADLTQRLRSAFILQQISFAELHEAMMALEPAAAASAARHVTPAQLTRIEDNLGRTEAALAAGHGLVELDVEFHALVADAASNRALKLAREPISNLFYPAFTAVMERLDAGGRMLEAHRRIAAALSACDPAEAGAWMARHVADFRRGYERAGLPMDAPVTQAPVP